MFVYKNVKYH